MLQLEETYKLARIIKRSMKQVESEPSMTPEEAVAALRALWKYVYPKTSVPLIRVRIVADELQLLYIYDKADFGNISDVYLRDVMKRMDF